MAESRDWFSTAGVAIPGAGVEATHGAVELRRVDEPVLVQSLPETLKLGIGCPTAVTIGKHSDNTVVLDLDGASSVQCQLALRKFQLPEQDKIHEALFLRDVSGRGTLVNGIAAFRPWHWIQEGDSIGILADDATQKTVINFYTAHYRELRRLPAALVALEEPPLAEAANGDAPHIDDIGPGVVQTRGRGARRGAVGTTRSRRGRGPKRRFGDDICGRVIDLRYRDWPDTYRVRVVRYDKGADHHHIHSRGLSTWDDESFEDEIDLNAMYASGDVTFIDSNGDSDEEASDARRPRKRGRGRR